MVDKRNALEADLWRVGKAEQLECLLEWDFRIPPIFKLLTDEVSAFASEHAVADLGDKLLAGSCTLVHAIENRHVTTPKSPSNDEIIYTTVHGRRDGRTLRGVPVTQQSYNIPTPRRFHEVNKAKARADRGVFTAQGAQA